MTAAATPIPTTLPERAFSLFCQGLRAPTISRQLGVPERTIRAWIASVRQDIAATERDRLAEELFRAIEHLHQLSAAAWAAFERDQNLPTPSLASPTTPDAPSVAPTSSPSAAPHLRGTASHGPRYLRLALDAQRQITSLLTRYGSGASSALTPTTSTTPTTLAHPASTPLPIAPLSAAARKTEIPAESATASGSPLLVGEGPGARSPLPAESATLPPDTSASTNAKIKIPAESATESVNPLRASSCPPWSSWLNPQPLSPPSVSSVSSWRLRAGRRHAASVSSGSSVVQSRPRPRPPAKSAADSTPNHKRTGRKSRRARK